MTTWRGGAVWIAGALAALAVGAAGPVGAVRVDRRATAAAPSPTAYLLAAQNRDGGFGGAPGQRSSTLYSGWAALGLAAKGRNPAAVSHGGPSLLSYIERHLATDAGSLERTILVAQAAGVAANDFGGRDLVSALQRDITADGSVQHKVDLTTFAGTGASLRWRCRAVADASLARSPAESQRRLQLCHRRSRGRRRRHRRRAAGDRGPGPWRDPACRRLYPRGSESRRRLPGPGRRRVQRPVHRLGGPGADRRASRCFQGAPPRLAVAAAVPHIADRAQWRHQLRASHVDHARVGDIRGGHGARRQVAPACPDPTRVAWGRAVVVPGPSSQRKHARTCPRGSSASSPASLSWCVI